MFIHVPKTAGTSMEHKLLPRTGGHHTAAYVRSQIGETAWREAFTFAFVRDPLDRFVSGWQHWKRDDNSCTFEAHFDRAARWVNERRKIPLSDIALTHMPHWAPQNWFIFNCGHRLQVDFVGRFHRLHDDWNAVCSRIGLDCDLPHYRKSDCLPSASYYTPERRAAVSGLYRDDYELLGSYFPESPL